MRRRRQVEDLAYIGQTGVVAGITGDRRDNLTLQKEVYEFQRVVAVERISDRTICIGPVTYKEAKAGLR